MPKFTSFTSVFHTGPYPAIDPTDERLSARGKTVLISGGGSGVGKVIALAFAQAQAANIIIFCRTMSTLTKAKASIEEAAPDSPSKIHVFEADMTRPSDLQKMFSSIKSTIGPVDVLVNSAAHLADKARVFEGDIDDWWLSFQINVNGSYLLTRAFIQALPPSGEGVLLNLTSVCGHGGSMMGFSSYNASKAAFTRVLETLHHEMPKLRVMSIHPGVYDSVMRRRSGNDGGPFDDEPLAGHFAVWAASPEADFLAGRTVWANWDVDELKARREEILSKDKLVFTLEGFPNMDLNNL
ncbi:hypothetical protein A1O1_08645 [Capronia coronata CBS 617.96]|uniref:Uncharacterized protein n=1 Tax=Capronia coronata CBS 617.96 TaxID=1182541 RepID=W9XT40_9EURO|nr:uncharacterized protein A1O1_08645 [Capronia coronata CBS 617.96]EXJ80500.1 hypothetical protein A1O1_08645 [Capronia coronata CBS 617.96]